MTSFLKVSALTVITFSAALSATAGVAIAGDKFISADQIVNALSPPALHRGLSVGEPRQDPTVTAREFSFVDTLRNRKTGTLTARERQDLAEITTTKQKIDLEIQFEYNSAEISKTSLASVQELGKALTSPNLKGSTFVVAGHTDGVGGDVYNQNLSERRADSIKRYLSEKFGINGKNLVSVGYGKTQPKDTAAPLDPSNRRVQVVNLDTRTASR